MIKTTHKNKEELLVNFNLPKIDVYLKANEKYFHEGGFISFEKELELIGDFTTMACHYIKTFELLCTVTNTMDRFRVLVDSINGLYHQFLRNILLNEKDFEMVMKRFLELRNLVNETFGEEFLF